jgi:delta 1-pyrroline-5-carboxylate dehydrogenase
MSSSQTTVTPSSQTTITPHNQQQLVTRTYPSELDLDIAIRRSSVAQKAWARIPLKDRLAIGTKFVVSYPVLIVMPQPHS